VVGRDSRVTTGGIYTKKSPAFMTGLQTKTNQGGNSPNLEINP
jgi:hypothetical protein